MLAELLSDLCMGEMGIFLCVENACIAQQFEVQQRKCSSPSDQYSLILTFLSLFSSMTLLSCVNLLEQWEDSLIQKTHFTSEFLEANALEFYEKK